MVNTISSSRLRGWVGVGALLLPLALHAATTYSDPAPFDRTGFASTKPWDVNDSGVIVGVSDTVGFIYSAGTFTSLSHPNATIDTTLMGITNDGTLVGTYRSGDPNAPEFHGFIYEAGIYSSFDVPGAQYTIVRHVSSDGRYLSGDWRDVSGANFGFAFDRQTLALTRFGDLQSVVQGVNILGQVTGSFIRTNPAGDGTIRGAFVYDLGTQVRTEYLDVNGLPNPRFRDINDQGLITGFVGTQPQAFVGTPGDWQVFSAMPGGTNDAGYGLNNSGTLVGFTQTDASTPAYRGWIASPIPEPGTWALWLLGLVPLAACTRHSSRGDSSVRSK